MIIYHLTKVITFFAIMICMVNTTIKAFDGSIGAALFWYFLVVVNVLIFTALGKPTQ